MTTESYGHCSQCRKVALLGDGLCVHCWDGETPVIIPIDAHRTVEVSTKRDFKAVARVIAPRLQKPRRPLPPPRRIPQRYGNARSGYLPLIASRLILGDSQVAIARDLGITKQRVSQLCKALKLEVNLHSARHRRISFPVEVFSDAMFIQLAKSVAMRKGDNRDA